MVSLEGKKLKSVELPKQFTEDHRPDLIKRAHHAFESHNQQPYGAFYDAGKRQSADLPRRRKKFGSPYGRGVSRVPRKSTWRRGTQFGWTGAVAPGTVGGRRAHPPKAEKVLANKLNIKERRKALRSALAMSCDDSIVKERGHLFTQFTPVVDAKIEALTKTKDIEKAMKAMGLEKELARVAERKVRAGKGTMRGRKYKTKKGPLLVVADKCALEKAGRNVHGVEVCRVKDLNVELLAPGGVPGRLTLYSETAVEKIKAEQLFLTIKKTPTTKKAEK